MAREYRLGIDLGTASVGLVAYHLDAEHNPDTLAWHHVRLFDEPLDAGPAGLASKAATRRRARLQRRQIDRRAGRQKAIAALGALLGVDQHMVVAKGDLPVVRARAARERVELVDLMRIFLKLGKRRGYAGEFSDSRKGVVADGSRGLQAELKRVAAEKGLDSMTLGEYLLWRIENGLPARLKVRTEGKKSIDDEVPNLYTLRQHVVDEFEQIWDTQQVWHPQLSTSRDGVPLRDIFKKAIFWNRPLRSVAGMVGQCNLEPTLSRAPRAQPAFQRFRIEKTLADLHWGAGRRAEPLSARQKAEIRALLEARGEVPFKRVIAQLDKAGCPGPLGKELNLDRLSREILPGNKTNHVFRKFGLHDSWSALDSSVQVSVINFLADLGSPEQLDDPEWHTRFAGESRTPRRFSDAMITFLELLRAHEKFDSLTKMGFDGGRASYSVKALNILTGWLDDPHWPGDWKDALRVDEEMAIRICYPQSAARAVERSETLPPAPKTGNAVVDKALRQLKWTIDRAMRDLGGPPAEIVIEMAREMGLGPLRRNERESRNMKHQKARKKVAHEIEAHGRTATPTRIRRVLLWQEQDCHCPYCGQLLSLDEALSGGSSEYEHVLPRKLTQVGMKTTEIVLAHYACNQRKGDRTPWAASQTGDVTWEAVEHMAEALRKKRAWRKAKLLLVRDFENEVLTDDSIASFADRQFHATAWVAKEAAVWLQPLCPGRVSTSRGELTALLRKHWKLDSVIPEVRFDEKLPVLDDDGKPFTREDFRLLRKVVDGHAVHELRKQHPEIDFGRRPNKRIDNRHHLIDAMVVGLVSRALFTRMVRDYKTLAESASVGDGDQTDERERSLKRQVRRMLPIPPPPLPNLRRSAVEAVRARYVSRKPDRYPAAAFFEDTAYSVSRGDKSSEAQLVLRAAVSTLGGADPKKVTIESARKGIAQIESDESRLIISQEFEKRVAEAMPPAEALERPIVHPAFGHPIKKVRCLQRRNSAGTARRIEHVDRAGTKHWKYLLHAGFAWVDIWQDQDDEIRHELKTVVDAMRAPRSRPPAGVLRIYKGDTVQDSKNGEQYRICSFKSKGLMLYLPLVEPRSFKEANENAAKGSKLGGTIAFSQALKRLKVVTEPHVGAPNTSGRVDGEDIGR